MKKALLAVGCALFMGQALVAQEAAQEITYVEDQTQGYVFNRFKDNWFITAEGGVNITVGDILNERKFGDRLAPAAGIYVGKWFSPILGLRVGGNYFQYKGLSYNPDAEGVLPGRPMYDEYYKVKLNEFGLSFDALLNVTNWWCGYKPNRVYNFIGYAGATGMFTYGKSPADDSWHYVHDKLIGLRAGIINSFRISKQMEIALDLRYLLYEANPSQTLSGDNRDLSNFSANLSLTYKFKKREWNRPMVPVCPEPENCDPLRARLDAADRRIEELEAQLKACLERPVERVVEKINAPLVTVYYPIGVSRLSADNRRVITAVAREMAANPDKKYEVTGWADTYTGTTAINERLREARANGVKKVLVRNGVAESQLTVKASDNVNLHKDLGEKCASLDRAVTITEKN